MRSRCALWILAVAFVVGGCGSSTSGVPVAGSIVAPTTTSSYVEPAVGESWDPCTIPDRAIAAAGLDVQSGTPNLFGDNPISPDWKTCIWTLPYPNDWYFLAVFSSEFDLDYFQRNDRFGSFTEVEDLGGVEFMRADRAAGTSCGVAFESTDGIVYFILDTKLGEDPLIDPCLEVRRVSALLLSALPPRIN